MNTAAKEKIDTDISRITIVGEIVPNKVNIPDGDEVRNFFVLLVFLKRKEFDEKKVELQGLNFDKVWENVAVAVGGVEIKQGNTLDEQIEVNEKRQKLKKGIAKLEKQARAEKQPRKKFEMVQRLREYQKKLEGLKDE